MSDDSEASPAPAPAAEVPPAPVNTRAYRAACVAFAIAIGGGVFAVVSYWSAETQTWLGVGLALALGGIGFGLVSWAKYMNFDEHVVQQRERLRTTAAEREELHDEVTMTRATLGRRKLLVTLFAGSLGSLVVGAIGLLGSLGPRPRGERNHTAWGPGKRLVTSDGAPVGVSSGGLDQLATVFPEGAVGRDDSQVVLLRLPAEVLSKRTVTGGAVDGWVAYSKICTHAGCSVGLFGVDNRPPTVVRQLVCPCHQSVFDPTDAAQPVGGPAPRSLAQLPLAVDAQGFLISTADFDRPVGPIAWNEG